jgi:hypothetical protein
MNNTQCRIKIQNRFSKPINVKNGIQQGDALVCLLLNTVSEMLQEMLQGIQEVPFFINLFKF